MDDLREEHDLSDEPRSTELRRDVRVVGVDGSPGGWVAVWVEARGINARFHESFHELVLAYPHVACIAIDVPIGLSSTGPRACDRAARALLGPRGSSVVPSPDHRLLGSPDFATVNERSLALTQKGVSRQVFGLYPKVTEIDQLMTPLLQNWIIEAHPEVSLREIGGGTPTTHSKRTPAGYEERRELLAGVLGVPMPTKQESREMIPKIAPDDVLDAAAIVWTAQRVADGQAARVTDSVELDRMGRRMEIVY